MARKTFRYSYDRAMARPLQNLVGGMREYVVREKDISSSPANVAS